MNVADVRFEEAIDQLEAYSEDNNAILDYISDLCVRCLNDSEIGYAAVATMSHDDQDSLSSNRVSTSADVSSLKSVLSEKEKDLELAARIGKHLLHRNKELQSSNEYLEEQIALANEQVTQLKHELQRKIDLLQTYNENENESAGSTPASERRYLSWNLLEKKLSMLEEENVSLKLEMSHLKCLTESLAVREAQIIADCGKQAAEANARIGDLTSKLSQNAETLTAKTDLLQQHQNDISQKTLLNKQLIAENEELTLHLLAAQETQRELSQELADLRDRYAEVMAMLSETRLELKSTQESDSILGFHSYDLNRLNNSLASEIEEAEETRSSADFRNCRVKPTNIAKITALNRSSDANVLPHLTSSVEPCSTFTPRCSTDRPKITKIFDPDRRLNFGRGQKSFNDFIPNQRSPHRASIDACAFFKSADLSDETSADRVETSSDDSDQNLDCPEPAGTPGMPGSKDLRNALKRLSLRKRVEAEYRRYKLLRRSSNRRASQNSSSNRNSSLPTPPTWTSLGQWCAENDGVTFLRSLGATSHCVNTQCLLVKPLRGSCALDHWRSLATPTFDLPSEQI